MPRIDPLLAALVSNRAESLRLSDGDIAHLTKGGVQHPLTRQPLAEGQLLVLLREMAPSEIATTLGGAEPLEFAYENAEGHFVAHVSRQDGVLQAAVSPKAAEIPRDAAHANAYSAAHGNGTSGSASSNGNGTSNGHGTSNRYESSNGNSNGNGNNHGSESNNGYDSSNGNGSHHETLATAGNSAPGVTLASSTPSLPTRVSIANSAAKIDIDALLHRLVADAGSDLHLRVGEPPMLRVHGELLRIEGRSVLEAPLVEAMLNAIMPDRNRNEFRESCDTDFAYEVEGLARFRANAFRDHRGPGGVFRVIPAKVATVEDLGITQEVQNLCYLTKGLVLVTGPTGSGKSTTLGGLIDLVNRSRNDHVITIEDPIEFVHVNKKCLITQRQVGLHTGSFKSALRAALREDPDIILVGELRDLETTSIAIETAETGHLVFATLHTTTAVGTIDRLIDQFPPDRQAQIRVMLADSLKGVMSQTLCKRLGGGRVAAREILLTIPAVSNLIREGKAFQIPSVMQTSRKLGMIQLGDVLIDLVDQGTISPQEGYVKSTDKNAFMNMLKNRGIDPSLASA